MIKKPRKKLFGAAHELDVKFQINILSLFHKIEAFYTRYSKVFALYAYNHQIEVLYAR